MLETQLCARYYKQDYGGQPYIWLPTLVENERLVTKKMTKIPISMNTFGLAITGG